MTKSDKHPKSDKHAVLRIYASSTDRFEKVLLYEYLVLYAHEYGINGATVYRGITGYGSSSKISNSRFWELTEKLPVVIELIDTKEKLELFYSEIEKDLLSIPKGCLVSLEPTKILLQKKGDKK